MSLVQTFDVQVPSVKLEILKSTVTIIAQQLEQNNKVSNRLTQFLNEHRWWLIDDGEIILDTTTFLLWQGRPTKKKYNSDQLYLARQDARSLHISKLGNWDIPDDEILRNVIKDTEFPLRVGDNYELKGGITSCLTADKQSLILDQARLKNGVDTLVLNSLRHTKNTTLLAYNATFLALRNNPFELLKEFKRRNFKLQPHPLSTKDSYAKAFHSEYNGLVISQIVKPEKKLEPKTTGLVLDIQELWKNIDYISTRLPPIDQTMFSDVDRGIWEFYAPKSLTQQFTTVKSSHLVRARNPALDIQEASVAIDFGTSSTVVAIRQDGRDELLRIGMQANDFKQHDVLPEHFENPTVLEMINLQDFFKAWHSEAYRPLVKWDQVHCSHQARASLRNNDSNSRVVSSILLRLKQWALRSIQDAQVYVTDQQEQGYEYQLEALKELNPVKGQAIEINQDYPKLDPIELYAWFLGMNINWRNRGIFLEYYLTFPVAYPQDTKSKILASFRRGLQRSLPESLLADEAFNHFLVEELASEPAAFAAAALERLDIEPTEQGVAYAVFDFGGGTTDFDYGVYREPTDDEADLYDHVIEHFGSSGDKFLGGENLLENLAYLVFKENQNICREKKIAFTKPLDAEKFAGSELLITQTQAAYTNTTLMMSKLRDFWEKGKFDNSAEGKMEVKLISRNNEEVSCELIIKQESLLNYLQQRIAQGLKNFFVAMNDAFSQQQKKLPQQIHILMAGNSSRSNIVLGLLSGLDGVGQVKNQHNKTEPLLGRNARLKKTFNEIVREVAESVPKKSPLVDELPKIFSNFAPKFKIHLPLNTDDQLTDRAITAKTGVALGLLRLVPGERLKVVNHALNSNDQQDSPFQYFVGTHRRNHFCVCIKRGQTYGEWVQLGAVAQGRFDLLYTSEPQASSSDIKRGSTGLVERKLRFEGNHDGQKVFARVIAAHDIELCNATDLDDVAATGGSNLQRISLS